jgi:Protein of unknown function (DUF2917)
MSALETAMQDALSFPMSQRTDARSVPCVPCVLCTLAPRHARTLRGCAGRDLVLLQGRLWLTEPTGGEDHVLVASQSLRLRAADGVVIECLGPEPALYRLA